MHGPSALEVDFTIAVAGIPLRRSRLLDRVARDEGATSRTGSETTISTWAIRPSILTSVTIALKPGCARSGEPSRPRREDGRSRSPAPTAPVALVAIRLDPAPAGPSAAERVDADPERLSRFADAVVLPRHFAIPLLGLRWTSTMDDAPRLPAVASRRRFAARCLSELPMQVLDRNGWGRESRAGSRPGSVDAKAVARPERGAPTRTPSGSSRRGRLAGAPDRILRLG